MRALATAQGECGAKKRFGLGERGDRKGAASVGEVRGEEAGWMDAAGAQGNWVLQMLRVQPRWMDQAHAEAGGGGGGQEDEEPGVVGGERCASCGGGGEDEGCAVGTDEWDGEVFDRASFSRLLRKVSIEDAKEYSRMSYLCNIAYMIPKIQPKCLRRYSLQFVTTSVQEKDRANPDRKQEQSTEKVRPAKVVRDGEISAPCGAMVLGNIHSLKAITPCAILDILSPPYSSEEGRHCSYFRRLSKSDPSGILLDRTRGSEFVWLEEYQPPHNFVIRRDLYTGPTLNF